MKTVIRADYVLVANSRIISSGESQDSLSLEFDKLGLSSAEIKPWREHQWGTIHNNGSTVVCAGCGHTRRSIPVDAEPCPFPEIVEDGLEITILHAAHVDSRCCNLHNHHAKPPYPHTNCIMR